MLKCLGCRQNLEVRFTSGKVPKNCGFWQNMEVEAAKMMDLSYLSNRDVEIPP